MPRKVAKLSRHLSVEYIGLVDEAIAPLLGHEGAARVLEITAAKIIEADPATHQERVEAEKKRRYVGLGRTDEFGLRMFIARIEAADAVWLDATISRVVEIIRPDHPKTSADELRTIAFGYLARPAELFAMLTENLYTDEPDETTATDDFDETVDPGYTDDPDDTEESEEAADPLNRAIAMPADVLAKLNDLNLQRLAPKIVLNVHLHEMALHGVATAVRVEGLGPVSLTQLKAMLTDCNVTVKPVIDLNDRVRATAYEHPEGLKERVYLITRGDYFPYANSTSRNTDYDHVTPYDEEDRTGQTGTHLNGPDGAFPAFSSVGDRFALRSPSILGLGTAHAIPLRHEETHRHVIPAGEAASIYNAPAGVDLYPGGPVVELGPDYPVQRRAS